MSHRDEAKALRIRMSEARASGASPDELARLSDDYLAHLRLAAVEPRDEPEQRESLELIADPQLTRREQVAAQVLGPLMQTLTAAYIADEGDGQLFASPDLCKQEIDDIAALAAYAADKLLEVLAVTPPGST